MVARRFEICLDANDPGCLRPFWAAALGYRTVQTDEGASDLVDETGEGPTLWFQRVPEEKTVKNRLHMDVWVAWHDAGSLISQLVGLGGSIVSEHEAFTVLADPEGNELCICWREQDVAADS